MTHDQQARDLAARYRRDGFVCPLDVLGADEAAAHRKSLEDAEAAHGQMHYRSKPYLLLRSAMEIARHPRLLDAVQAVLGPDLLLWEGGYIIKEAGDDSFVSWHQDLTYWGLDSDECVSAWVALSAATTHSGCMLALPGSHRRGRMEHRDTRDRNNILHRGQEIAGDFDESGALSLVLAPGQASLHHGWVLHSSRPNRGNDRRIGLNLQYLSPRVRQLVMKDDSALLVRGEDRFGHFKPERVSERDFDPEVVAWQQDADRRRKEVWDS